MVAAFAVVVAAFAVVVAAFAVVVVALAVVVVAIAVVDVVTGAGSFGFTVTLNDFSARITLLSSVVTVTLTVWTPGVSVLIFKPLKVTFTVPSTPWIGSVKLYTFPISMMAGSSKSNGTSWQIMLISPSDV